MYNKDQQNILDVKEAVDKILLFTNNINNCQEFEKEVLVFDAVMMNIVVIGEAVGRLSESYTNKYNDIEWPKIKGLRNIIAHDYFGIDIEEIWQIIHDTIPQFLKKIEGLLKDFQT